MRFETLVIHGYKEAALGEKDVAPSIHLSTTFEREKDGSYPEGYSYTRRENPNRINAVTDADVVAAVADPEAVTRKKKRVVLQGLEVIRFSLVAKDIPLERRAGIALQAVGMLSGKEVLVWDARTATGQIRVEEAAALADSLDKYRALAAKGKKIAAKLLEAAEADIVFADGRFAVTGTDRAVALKEVARAAFQPAQLPAGVEPGLYETGTFSPKQDTWPNGCHVCEVEVDPDTGATTLVRYAIVDDVGTVINPVTLKGQIHGGVAQGVGQALMFFAPSAALAIGAAALTGFGFSLSFPAFGVEAIKRVAPQNRGVALGAYAACFDLTMGVGVPALGLAVAAFGPASAFALGALTAVLALGIALVLLTRSARP